VQLFNYATNNLSLCRRLSRKRFSIGSQQQLITYRSGNLLRLDTDNLIQELTELGKSEKRTLESNLMILLAHLLKLKVQHDAPAINEG
jgi:hypothetical protein